MNTESIAPRAAARQAKQPFPPEVQLILSALEAGGHDDERRHAARMKYHVRAILRMFSDGSAFPGWELYTRDASPRGLGFICQRRPPLGHGGAVELMAPDGRLHRISCTLFRCREASHGWFEGAVYFNREQWLFWQEQAEDEPWWT